MNRISTHRSAVRRFVICTFTTAGAVGIILAASAPADAATSVQTLRDIDATALTSGLVGTGVTITAAEATGQAVQAASYTGLDIGQPGLASGVALSSGSLIAADPESEDDLDFTYSALSGPNKALTTSGDFGGAGDADLTTLAGATTYDAATLTLSVVPEGTDLHLSFGLGSEEYPGWAEQNFRDSAAIWVNGTLCSTVPGDADPIGTTTVNAGTNADLYNANVTDNTPAATFDTEFNGFTDALECDATVEAGKSATIKAAVADTRDGQVDTTLLIGAASITSTPAAPTDPTGPADPADPADPVPGAAGAGGTTNPGSTAGADSTPSASFGKLSSTGYDPAASLAVGAGLTLLGGLATLGTLVLRRFRPNGITG